MKVYQRKPRHYEPESRTIGTIEADLTEDVIRTYSLGPALKRIGRALARQFDRRPSRDQPDLEVVGVNLLTLGFQLLMVKPAPRVRPETEAEKRKRRKTSSKRNSRRSST